MRYDLPLLYEFCQELGLAAQINDPLVLKVSLGEGAVLCFENFEAEDDSLLGFVGTPWHTHGDIWFNDPRGYHIELDAPNILTGLKDGSVLLCEIRTYETLIDRLLIHSEYNDDLRGLQPSERLIIRRANLLEPKA